MRAIEPILRIATVTQGFGCCNEIPRRLPSRQSDVGSIAFAPGQGWAPLRLHLLDIRWQWIGLACLIDPIVESVAGRWIFGRSNHVRQDVPEIDELIVISPAQRQSQPIDPFVDLAKDLVEARFRAVAECAARREGLVVRFARCRITDNEGFVLSDILVVGPRKTLRLVRLVFIGTNEILHVVRASSATMCRSRRLPSTISSLRTR